MLSNVVHGLWHFTAVVLIGLFAAPLSAGDIAFRTEELPTRLTVGYAVRLIDMNGDKKLDIAIVDSDRILWLENPTWKEHILIEGQTKKDNVCFAPSDIDGDGQIDFAVGADWRPFDTKTGGTIQWIGRGADPKAKWDVNFIGEEPTVHRMQFADLDADGREELIVVPLMGRDTTKPNFAENPVRVLSYAAPKDPRKERWLPQVLNADLHVAHNFQPVDVDRNGTLDLLVVSFEGVHWLERQANGSWQRSHIGVGNQETSPNKGASEIRLGRFAKGAAYIATIEPWHGHQVVVYRQPADPQQLRTLWERTVLDEQLKWGHAVWPMNLDDDADEELVIGIRDHLDDNHRSGVRIYDPRDDSGKSWDVQRVDPGGVAVEDLVAGDLNGDGRADIVAVGRATRNVRVYWNGGR
jgi:hypothetical protein